MGTVSATVRGYCEELQEDKYIRVNYTEVRVLGVVGTLYKKAGFSCRDGS